MSENVYVCPRPLGSIVQAKSWLLSPFSYSSIGFLFLWILQGLFISSHTHSNLFLPFLLLEKTGADWTGSFFMQSEMILFCPPSFSSDFLYHGSFGSTTGAALVSLHTHALVLPHLLRCSYQSCLGQHLSPAQLPLCSEGLLLSTVCTWAGLLTFSSAKKAASFREGFTWNSFVDWLQRCLSYCCSSFTAYLHFTKYSPMKLQKSK